MGLFLFVCLLFLFKQKTAYEMRISDWSSDVCSSDLSVERSEDVESRSAPGEEIAALLARPPDQVGDHRHRQGSCDIGNPVHDIPVQRLVDHRSSEARRVGNEWVSACCSPRAAVPYNKKNIFYTSAYHNTKPLL